MTITAEDKKSMSEFVEDFIFKFDVDLNTLCEDPESLPYYVGQGISRTTFWVDNYPEVVFKFCAGSEDNIDRYPCEREIKVYQIAREEGLGKYFAELSYLGDYELIDGEVVPVYVQAAVDSTWSDDPIVTEDDIFHNHSYKKEIRYYSCTDKGISNDFDDESFSAYFLRRYGYEAYEKLSEFISEWSIEDLHFGNWGVKGRDVLILDYAQ